MGDAGLGETGFVCGDELRFRFLRIVTFRIKFESHSRFGSSSTSRPSLPSSPLSLSIVFASSFNGASTIEFLGVVSSSSRSKARPSPRFFSTTPSRAPVGVLDLLDFPDESGSSLAVVNDSARDEGCVKKAGRGGVTLDAAALRGGLGSGGGGLR